MPAQTIIKVRRDTAADWAGSDPALAEGEMGFETDTGKFKIGNGTLHWLNLEYATDWDNVTSKPTEFTPADHAATHATGGGDAITIGQSQVTDLTTNLAAKATNPMTAVGDLIVGGTVTSGVAAPARLAKGTDGNVLSLVSGTPAWTAPAAAGVTSVSATAPVTSTGGATPTIALNPISNTNIASNANIGGEKIALSLNDTDLTRTAAGVGYKGIPRFFSNPGTGAFTLAAEHAGQFIPINGAGRQIVIPANSAVAFPVGTTIMLIGTSGSSAATINITTDELRLAGTGAQGQRTLGAYGMATVLKIDTTQWIISGNGVA